MAEGRRDQLLDAAERVIVRRGLAQATVADITSEAGVAKGTFYLYFATKDDVVRALKQRMYDFLLERMSEAYLQMTAGDWWGQVDGVIAAIVEFDLEHREWHRMLGSTSAAATDSEPQAAQIIDVMTTAIRQGVEAGVFSCEDPELFAVLLYEAVEGATHRACMADEEPDPARLVTAMQTFCRKALA
jgi:AcrR family transcriptional regulator